MLSAVKKSLLLLALLLINCQAQPLEEQKQQQRREQRQLKNGASEADVKMMAGTANMTPTAPMQLSLAGFNQMPLGLTRYPNYPGLFYGAGAQAGAPFLGMPGLQTNIANGYPGYSDPNLGLGFNTGANFGLGGFPGNPQNAGYMYGQPMYGNQQLGTGFAAGAPNVDSFAALNNIINMANVQGLSGAAGLYPQAGAAGLYPQAGAAGLYPQAGAAGMFGQLAAAGNPNGIYGQLGAGAANGLYGQAAGMPLPSIYGASNVHGAADGMRNTHSYAPAY
ncbi:CG13216 [Drosophila busckii]|uniref:CG13216 n=1 Tax=Drosophila busckii TaxID=30019 RepID=A0A0M5J2L4_DROBS|nr:collagen alpha-2(IV) chain [Drosophila busckii]ALC41468.1 CG13216 [Drosophila busckii]